MPRIVLVCGAIAGAVAIAAIIATIVLTDGHSILLGYLVMLVALSLVFVGIRQYRDRHLGGGIRFGTAVLVGLGISVVAGVVYAAGWEAYLAATGYDFMASYSESVIEGERAKGATAAEPDALRAEMDALAERYERPWFRLPMTFLEIFPVGVLVTLVSAAILKQPRPLPAG